MSTPAAERPRASRPLLIVLALAVVAAVVVLGVMPLLSGGGDDAALVPVPLAPSAAGSPTEPTAGAPTETPAPADTGDVEVVTPRDPFSPLVQPTEAPTAAAQPAAAVDAPAQATGASAPADAATGTRAPVTAPAPPDAPRPGPDATIDGTEVSLADVFTGADGSPRILLAVEGTGSEAAAGDTVTDRFRVVSIDGTCATLATSSAETTLCRETSTP